MTLSDFLVLLGAVALVAGAAMFRPAAGVVVLGIVLMVGAFAIANFGKPAAAPDKEPK